MNSDFLSTFTDLGNEAEQLGLNLNNITGYHLIIIRDTMQNISDMFDAIEDFHQTMVSSFQGLLNTFTLISHITDTLENFMSDLSLNPLPIGININKYSHNLTTLLDKL